MLKPKWIYFDKQKYDKTKKKKYLAEVAKIYYRKSLM